MSHCYITVDEGNDTAMLSSKNPPTYEAVAVPSPVEGEPDGRLVFCVFEPQNGASRGKILRVPFARIISVSENKP